MSKTATQPIFSNTMTRTLAVALVALFVSSLVAAPSLAGKKAKSILTEARFISFDPETKTIEVMIKKTGDKPKNKDLRLRNGKTAEFKVKPEGSVLQRTSVTLNGKRAYITDIPADKSINIYWVEDEQDPTKRFARKIDMVLSDEELEARDKEQLEAERKAGRASDE